MSRSSSRPSVAPRNSRSCKRCNERKVRCDRNNPCGACVKFGNLCAFPGPKRAPRTLNRPPVGELLARLTELETEVEQLRSSRDLELETHSQRSSKSSNFNRDQHILSPEFYHGFCGLLQGEWHGKSNRRWSQDSMREQYLQPLQIQTLWLIYQKNVMPLIAVLHLPTTARIIEDATKGLSIDPAREALVLSICFAAAVSMEPQQSQSALGLEYQAAIRVYGMAVNQALDQADFVKSPKIFTLQAAVLYLLCARVDGDTRLVWAQSAVVIRLAQSQNIHRDGKKIGLSPFETEIRRRLWWYICILDMVCSEDQGVDMQIRPGTFDTQYPFNVDGVDLEPHMAELPPEKQGFTDITLCLVTCFMINEVELSTHPLSTVASVQSREDWIKSVGATLHERYLNHFDLRIPIHWVFATIARLHLSKVWVSVHKQLSSSDPQETEQETESEYRGSVLRTAIELVEFAYFLQTNGITRHWGWLCRSYKQKEAIAYILDELSTRPNGPETDRAWETVTKTTSLWMQGPGTVGGVPEKPLLELIQRADILREDKWKDQNGKEMVNLVGAPPLADEEMIPESWTRIATPVQNSTNVDFSEPYIDPSTLAWLQGIWPYQDINELQFAQ